MAHGSIKQRLVKRNGQGFKEQLKVLHSVTTRRSNYDYHVDYPPDATDADIVRDLRTLKNMADEQADAMDALDSLLNQTYTSSGLTALITSVTVHFEKPHHCQLMLTFYIKERRFWATKTFEAGTPNQLPQQPVLEAFVFAYLNELAAD
jgi:translation initiation factor 2 beta subunit (eIF-2beta)/eIF-5